MFRKVTDITAIVSTAEQKGLTRTVTVYDVVHFTDRAFNKIPSFSVWNLMSFPTKSVSLESIFVMALKQIFFEASLCFIPQGTALCDIFLDCTMLVVMHFPCVAVKPRTVQITTLAAPLSAGKTQHLQCETWGSVPPAYVIWLLDGEMLENAPTSVCIPSITFFSLSPRRGRGNKRNSLMTTHSTVHYTTV